MLSTLLRISIVALLAPALVGGVSGHWASAGMGSAVSLIGAALGLVFVQRGIARDDGSINPLLAAVATGMLIRMGLLAVGLVLVLRVLELAPLPMVISFFLVYAAAQILEILHILRAAELGSNGASS